MPDPARLLAALLLAMLPWFALAQAVPESTPVPTPGMPQPACADGSCDPFGRAPYPLRPGPPATQAEPSPNRLTLSLTLELPLQTTQSTAIGAARQGSPPVSPTLQAGLRFVPAENFFANINFYKYLWTDRQQPWNPDFTYSFGYDNWRPGTFSLIYGNYTGNRLPGQGATVTRVEEGTLSAAYKFQPPASWSPWLKFDDKDDIHCSSGANLTPRYTAANSVDPQRNKTSLALGCRYSTPSHFFFMLNALAYPRGGQQQPWDPDYIYGFGWFDWRPGSVNIQYFNYSGNRFPWRSAANGQGQFRNGSVAISWTGAW